MEPRADKEPFAIDRAMEALREVTATLPKAGLFLLQDEGYGTPFEILIACILSIRTLDETMLAVARRLFACAHTPEQVAALPLDELDGLIASCTFHEGKARQIHAIAQTCVEQYGNALPCDESVLLGLTGVGPKCAGLTLGIACGEPHIGVDVHVHRVVNRWGYVKTKTPEQTLLALEKILPRAYWIELNRTGMPFGKLVCTGTRPFCSTCPLLPMCPQIGITTHR